MKASAAKKQAFCEALVKGQTPDTAAQAIGVSRSAVYNWKASDAAFAAAWAEASERKIQVVENVLYRKAVQGEPWAVCFFLRGHRPELFSRRLVAVDPDEPPIVTAEVSGAWIYPRPELQRDPVITAEDAPMIDGEAEEAA
jgi:hypothetical protein